MKKTIKVKVWAVVRKEDNKLFDDGFDYNRIPVYFYPLFKNKRHAILYAEQTWNSKRLDFKFKYQEIAKIIPVEIVYKV